MSLNIEKFRNKMEIELEKTLQIKSVQVSGRTLEEALKEASMELLLPVKSLEYEILERGRNGFMGFKTVPYRIIAFESDRSESRESLVADIENALNDEEIVVNTPLDGRFSIRLSAQEHIMLKVFPPVGNGSVISKEQVMVELRKYEITELDDKAVATVVKRADSMWIKIGTYKRNTENDALIYISVMNNDMEAFVNIVKPGKNGASLSVNDIRSRLESEGIRHGIIIEKIQEIEDFPVYETDILVARGTEPINGGDAEIVYEFETEVKTFIKEREDKSVDFKEINEFQNVEKGQIVARKLAPKKGKNGMTVYGKKLNATDGVDKEINIGSNVELRDNGNYAVASINGHVIIRNGKICVDSILCIPGNVDIRVGNINILGSVEVLGNVEDGMSIKAEGNINVAGYVGRANLNAGENIVVARGINGGDSQEFGHIKAGKNIWASFIQNAEAKAGEFIIVSSGIVNAKINAERKVLCQGRRAKIVGGYIHAAEEVNAVILGTPSGTQTFIEVGTSPAIKEELNKLLLESRVVNSELDPIQLKLRKFVRHYKLNKERISKENVKKFKELYAKSKSLEKQIADLHNQINERQEYLDSLLIQGRVSASSLVHAGVIIHINDAEYLVKQSYTYPISFVLQDNFIQLVNYKDIEDDIEIRSEV